MEGKVLITASVNNLEEAKELLNDLETLSEKYELTIDLKICPQVIPARLYELT